MINSNHEMNSIGSALEVVVVITAQHPVKGGIVIIGVVG